ncbi:MAG: NAD-dependent succinate-semialdehyde dehydrogenase [Planctomycetaceae bacterium]
MFSSPLISKLLGFIDGQWCAADSAKTMPAVNPATGEIIAEVPAMGSQETTRAVSAAARALSNSASIDQRRQWLIQLADLITEHRTELGRIITHEHGKPLPEAEGEADYAASFFRYYAGAVSHLEPRRLQERPRNHTWTIYQRPAGVAALITPWNFPLAMLAKKFSAALAADCCCVIKPSSKTPLTMIALFSLMEQLNLPAGKASLVMGPSAEISNVLCRHPDVRVISFTGSTQVGRQLMAESAPYLKRLSLELGGNAPFIIFEDADLSAAAEHLIANKFRGSGQTCVCANRIYVHCSIADSFAARLAAGISRIKVGNGMDHDVTMGPLINRDAFSKVQQHLDDAVSRGAIPVAGPQIDTDLDSTGCFFPPVILRKVTAGMQCVSEETFGPLVPIIEFETEDEVVSAANRTEYGLAAYVFTGCSEQAKRIIPRLNFGHVGYNTGSGPTAEAPFGGMKHSGFGREGGLEGLHDFIETQTVPQP